MITHEEIREALKEDNMYIVVDYITQQEKKDKLFERLYNVCKEYKHTSIGLCDDSEFINTMNDIEEELK